MSDTAIEEVSQELELSEVLQELSVVKANHELLQENMAEVVLALDNAGWKLLGEQIDSEEIPLGTVKTTAKTTRALLALNPLIKRGVAVRNAYIWGGGVRYVGLDESNAFYKNANNKKFFLSAQAHHENESCLATDGNLFLYVKRGRGRGTHSISRIPMRQITGTVSNPDNREEIWFYKREFKRIVNTEKEQPEEKEIVEYVPALDYDARANGRPGRIKGKAVNWSGVIAHQSVNKQVGWLWGLPDLTSVIFWAGAHKEFLENSARLIKSLSRFAFKATAPTPKGVQATATKVATQPTRDAMGNPQDVGSTAVMAQGANLQAMGRTAGQVDFKAGTPLAGYVAAGLEIPLTELLSDSSDANRSSAETLADATEKAMKTRQRVDKDFMEAIFDYLGMDVTVKFPPIEEEAIYRQIQSIAQAIPFNVLSAKEIRKMFAKAFDLDEDSDDLPTEEELGLMLASNTTAGKEQAELAKTAAKQPANGPDQNPNRNPGVKKPATNNPSNGDNSYRKDAGANAYNSDTKK